MNKILKLYSFAKMALLKVIFWLRFPLHAKIKVKDRTILFHDMSASTITEQIFLNGFDSYEHELAHFLKLYDKPVQTFIDAGANIGYYSVLSSIYLGDHAKIIAIEPFPNNLRYMEKLKKNNGLNFEILPYALSDTDGQQKTFYVPKDQRSSKFATTASLVNKFKGTGDIHASSDFYEIIVTTLSLNSVLQKKTGRAILKMDIEGHELEALKPAKDILTTQGDLDVIVEIMINDKDKNEVFSFFQECGYNGYLITNAGLVFEDRPLTLPYYNHRSGLQRTCWKNHFFTKRTKQDIATFCLEKYGYVI